MLSLEETLQKARNYCSYQERYTKQLWDKLEQWGVRENKRDDIIKQMQKESYLDDNRYAQFYARGKHKTRKWGRIRIKMELQAKGLNQDVIKEALYAIDDDDYLTNLKELLENKLASLSKEKNEYIKKNKAAQSLMRKGYEGDLVWDILRNTVDS